MSIDQAEPPASEDLPGGDVGGSRSSIASMTPNGPRQWAAMVVALMFLAGAVGYFMGTRDDGGRPGVGSVDVGFLQDMISHHEQAIQMANVEIVDGAEPGVQVFAREIVLFQSYEIGLMERQLGQWGYRRENRPERAMAWMDMSVAVEDMPGLATEKETDALSDLTGRDTDALFLKLIQDHHAGGVHMAEYAAKHASNPFVRDIAARMARNQRIEIGELEAARKRTGLRDDPPGYGT